MSINLKAVAKVAARLTCVGVGACLVADAYLDTCTIDECDFATIEGTGEHLPVIGETEEE